LDNFKRVDGSLGHHAGDRLLIAAAKRLEGYVCPSDNVARRGGDEFSRKLPPRPTSFTSGFRNASFERVPLFFWSPEFKNFPGLVTCLDRLVAAYSDPP